MPLSPAAATTIVAQDGQDAGNGSADTVTATPDLFAALGVPLVSGRTFAATDSRGAQPVAIVNETAARQLWRPGIVPIGRAIEMRDWGAPYTASVVGIVGDVRQNGLGAAPRHIARLVWARGVAPVVAGLLTGAAASIAIARVLQGLVFGVPPRDPASLASAALLIAGCAAVAITPAAWRATRLDPVAALRAD